LEIGAGAKDLALSEFANKKAEKWNAQVIRINPDNGLGKAKIVLPVLQKQVAARSSYEDFSTYGRAV